MNRWLLLPSVVLSIYFALAYLLRCRRTRRQTDFRAFLNMVLAGPSLVSGVALVIASSFEEARFLLDDAEPHLFLAGSMLIAIMSYDLWKEFHSN